MLRALLFSAMVVAVPACTLAPRPVAVPAGAGPAKVSLAAELEGVWRDEADLTQEVRFLGSQYLEGRGDRVVSAARIMEVKQSTLRLCDYGTDVLRDFTFSGDELVLRDPATGALRRLRREQHGQDELLLRPWPLAPPANVSAARAEQIGGELGRRERADQGIPLVDEPPVREWGRFRGDKAAPGPFDSMLRGLNAPWLETSSHSSAGADGLRSMRAVDIASKNGEWLKKLVAEVGWIDAKRFGYGASEAAFLITQHSYDLALMLAALPEVKQDVDAGLLNGDPYALLFDRLQLALGERQRYGSQFRVYGPGDVVVFPVEDEHQVEALRHDFGMIPLTQMVALFGASKVHFSPACQPPATAPAAAAAPLPARVPLSPNPTPARPVSRAPAAAASGPDRPSRR